MMLTWLKEQLGAGSGYVSPWLVVDLLLFYFLLQITRKMILPVARGYRLGWMLERLCGTDGDKHWFYGHKKKYGRDEAGLLNSAERTKEFPSIFCKWVGPFVPQLEISHPDQIFSGLMHIAPKNELAYRFFRPWLGDGLVLSHGKRWKRNRRLLTPAFHYNILKPYLKIFNDSVKIFLDNLEGEVGNPVEISRRLCLMTLDIMLQCAMSFKTDCQNIKGEHPYIEAVRNLTKLVIKRLFNPFYLSDWIFNKSADGRKCKEYIDVVHKHAEEIIALRRRAISESTNQEQKKEPDFLDILLNARDEDDKGLTDSEIRDEVDTFLFAGHDTTSNGISWLLYNLAKYPELQEKCRQEIEEVVESEDDIEWEVLSKINYCTMFIKESMRLYPPAPLVGRYLTSPLSLKNGVTIPQHCNMSINIFACHRNEHVWENPERFDPERFTLENISKRSPHAFIPFSAGPRNCIGQNFAMNEIKVVLCQVLRRYRFYLDSDTPTPIMKPKSTLGNENGIILKFASL